MIKYSNFSVLLLCQFNYKYTYFEKINSMDSVLGAG
jgi:hypothetical protein